MKKVLSVLLSICMMSLMFGCSAEPKEQSATYVLTEEEAGMFTMTDTQTLRARGDEVYELLETTTLEFAELDKTTLEMLVAYYDDTVANMQAAAPEGVEVSSAYEGNVYTLVMNLYLEHADILISAAFGAAVFVGAMKEKEAALDRRVRIICRFAGKSVAFNAVVDTGNTLCDYLTKRPVIVAGPQQLGFVRAMGIPMRLIAADTAGGRQLMQMAMPEETILETGGSRFCVEAALAFSPALGNEALLPASLLIKRRVSINGGGLLIWKESWRRCTAASSRET